MPISRKGKRKIAEMSLNTAPSVKPTIINGRVRSQMTGSKNINTSASGQHMTNSMHHNITAITNLISASDLSMGCKGRTKISKADEGPVSALPLAVNDKLEQYSVQYRTIH